MEAYRCVSCEVRTSFTYKKYSCPRNKPWKPIDVFSVTYEHHLHIYKSKVIPVTARGGPQVFPVRYEHHPHIQK
jgi:hypothetical protein